MPAQGRSQHGRFAPKSDENREVRSLRLTDSTWQRLGELAALKNLTRSDLLELWMQADTPGQQAGVSLSQLDDAIAQVLDDPAVTRHGKDRGSVRRALEAIRDRLSLPRNTR